MFFFYIKKLKNLRKVTFHENDSSELFKKIILCQKTSFLKHKKLKRGKEIELTISDLAFGGKGIAKVNDLIYFVKMLSLIKKSLLKLAKLKKNILKHTIFKHLTNQKMKWNQNVNILICVVVVLLNNLIIKNNSTSNKNKYLVF